MSSIPARLAQKYPAGFMAYLAYGKTRTLYCQFRALAFALEGEDCIYFSVEKMFGLIDRWVEQGYKDSGFVADSGFDAGKIEDMQAYAQSIFPLYLHQISMLQELGIKHITVTLFHYQAFISRGDEYAHEMVMGLPLLTSKGVSAFYMSNNICPRFLGLDILLRDDTKKAWHQIALELLDFQRKFESNITSETTILYWELFPIPQYTLLQGILEQGIDLSALMSQGLSPNELQHQLWKLTTRSLFGEEIPKLGFYLGSNYNGDQRVRSAAAAVTLDFGLPMFFTPFPNLLMTSNHWTRIFESILRDSARRRSAKIDYGDADGVAGWMSDFSRSYFLSENLAISGLKW